VRTCAGVGRGGGQAPRCAISSAWAATLTSAGVGARTGAIDSAGEIAALHELLIVLFE